MRCYRNYKFIISYTSIWAGFGRINLRGL